MDVFNSDMLKILEIKCNYDITKKQKKRPRFTKQISAVFLSDAPLLSEGEDNNTLNPTSLFAHPCATLHPILILFKRSQYFIDNFRRQRDIAVFYNHLLTGFGQYHFDKFIV